MSGPQPTGAKAQNPYCVRCSKHLGLPFHETNEHDEASERADLHAEFNAIVDPPVVPPTTERGVGS